MISTMKARRLIDDLLEEQAFVIGGMAVLHGMSDEVISGLMKNLGVIRGRILRRLDARAPVGRVAGPLRRPHPAIEEFLRSLRTSTS